MGIPYNTFKTRDDLFNYVRSPNYNKTKKEDLNICWGLSVETDSNSKYKINLHLNSTGRRAPIYDKTKERTQKLKK